MRQFGIILACALTVLALCYDKSSGEVEGSKQSNVVKGLQLRLRLNGARLSVKQHVIAHMEIHNTLATDSMIHLSAPDYDFKFDVTVGEEREPVSLTEHGWQRLCMPRSGSAKSRKIHPGQFYATELDLSQLYDLSSPGIYCLSVRYTVKTGTRQWTDLVVKDVFLKLVEEEDIESEAAHGIKPEKPSEKKAADTPDNAVQQGSPALVEEPPQRPREEETGKVPVATTEKSSPTAAEEPQRFRAEKETREMEKVEPKQAKETKKAKAGTNRVLSSLIIAVIVLAGAVVFLITRRKGRGAARLRREQ